jgi:hypothetical protein
MISLSLKWNALKHPDNGASPGSQDAWLTHSALLQNSPASLFRCNGACLAVFTSLQSDYSTSPCSQDAYFSTPQCCKTPLPRCFTATERVWLFFRRCKLI